MLKALSMVDWTSGSGRRSGILEIAAFFAFSMHLWAFLFTESKKHSVAARLQAVVSLDGSMRLAIVDSFNDKFSFFYTLVSTCFSPLETSRASSPELLNTSISGTTHVLVRTGVI